MSSIWEKAISILVGNLNSGRSYLIAAVFEVVKSVISLTYLYHILLVCKKALKSALFMFCPMQKKKIWGKMTCTYRISFYSNPILWTVPFKKRKRRFTHMSVQMSVKLRASFRPQYIYQDSKQLLTSVVYFFEPV